MGKRENFKKSLAVLGITGTMALTGFAGHQMEEQRDMSKYNLDNKKYEEYVKDSKEKEILNTLEDNIDRYEDLKNKSKLNDTEKEELEMLSEDLKSSMRSGDLADFYLKNVLKEKLKDVYDAEKVVTNYRSEDEFSIQLYDKYGNFDFMDKKDEVLPIKNAMRDIATLQGYEGKEKVSKSELDNFVKIFKNMKGFSNIEFIKKGDQPLTYAELDLENDRDF